MWDRLYPESSEVPAPTPRVTNTGEPQATAAPSRRPPLGSADRLQVRRSDVAILVIAAIAAAATVVLAARHRRRTRRPALVAAEREPAVGAKGNRRPGEADLRERIECRGQLAIHALPAGSRNRYQEQWRQIQARVVDHPSASLTWADALVTEVMRASGFPMDSFEAQSEVVSIDHSDVVRHYRTAHLIFVRNQTTPVSAEQLRQAFASYRALFSGLLGAAGSPLDPSRTDR
jgi:hypothetical protein